MKIKTITIIFMMLLLPIIFYVENTQAEEADVTINVSIIEAIIDKNIQNKEEEKDDTLFVSAWVTLPYNILNNYTWIVNNTIYNFTAHKEKHALNRSIYTDPEQTDVLYYDGFTPDYFSSTWNGDIKQQYTNFVDRGGGFIGRCGGATFPLKLSNEPDTTMEYIVDNNAFLGDMKTSSYMKWGFPIFSENFKWKRYNNLIIFEKRDSRDPQAIGWGAYCYPIY